MPDVKSLRDRVQARRTELQKQATETFDVPGYEGILRARYRVLSWKEINRIGERIQKLPDLDDSDRQLYAAADSLIVACEAVYDAALDQDRKPDDPPPEGQRWGATLAHELGFPEPKNARQAVFAIFTRDTQVMTHHATVMDWQDGENERVDEEMLGESEPLQPSE